MVILDERKRNDNASQEIFWIHVLAGDGVALHFSFSIFIEIHLSFAGAAKREDCHQDIEN